MIIDACCVPGTVLGPGNIKATRVPLQSLGYRYSNHTNKCKLPFHKHLTALFASLRRKFRRFFKGYRGSPSQAWAIPLFVIHTVLSKLQPLFFKAFVKFVIHIVNMLFSFHMLKTLLNVLINGLVSTFSRFSAFQKDELSTALWITFPTTLSYK